MLPGGIRKSISSFLSILQYELIALKVFIDFVSQVLFLRILDFGNWDVAKSSAKKVFTAVE